MPNGCAFRAPRPRYVPQQSWTCPISPAVLDNAQTRPSRQGFGGAIKEYVLQESDNSGETVRTLKVIHEMTKKSNRTLWAQTWAQLFYILSIPLANIITRVPVVIIFVN